MLNIIKDKEGAELDKVIEDAMAIINLYPDIFPHMYKQGFKLKKYFPNDGIVLQDGVLITFNKYKKSGRLSRSATTFKKAGDFILHQIASDRTHPGATKRVLDEFVTYCKKNHAENLFLAVKVSNTRAVSFYERFGFIKDSDIKWHSKKEGEIPGIIFRLKLVADKNIETICI